MKRILCYIVSLLAVCYIWAQIDDILEPSDSGDMMSWNYLWTEFKAYRGNIAAINKIYAYYEFNKEDPQSLMLAKLLISERTSTPTQWAWILQESIKYCACPGSITPSEIEYGYQNAYRFGGLNAEGKLLERQWRSGKFPNCLPPKFSQYSKDNSDSFSILKPL